MFVLIPAKTHTLVIGGDIMLNGIKPGSEPFKGIRPILNKADFSLANLEVPLTNIKSPTTRKVASELKAKTQFVLKAEPRHAAELANTGINAVSLANNHSMDFGAKGLAQNILLLRHFGILSAGAGSSGAKASSLAVIVGKDGFRVGLLSALAFVGRSALRKCSPAGTNSPGVNVLAFDGRIDEPARTKLHRWIGGARAQCDYLVVALHWGIERQTKPTGYQIALGRAVADAGADLVWGAHPHVLQPTETYKSVPILYSTGNLVSSMSGRSALFKVRIAAHKSCRLETIPLRLLNGKTIISNTEARTYPPKRILNQKARLSGH